MNNLKKIISITIYLIMIGVISSIGILSYYQPNQWIVCLLLLVIFLYLINAIFSIYIFYSNRNDVRKKCWLLFFTLAPILAPLFFLWLGYNPISKKDINKFKLNLKKYSNYKNETLTNDETFDSLNKLLSNKVLNIPTTGKIEYIRDVEKSLAESINIIRQAKKYIFLNYYIIANSNYLKIIFNELILKSKQGVKIYFIYDWVGSNKFLNKRLIKKFKENFNIVSFKPSSKKIISSNDNNRSHKKYLIADNKIAIYGGANISDEYINQNIKYNYWLDSNFIIKGEVVKSLIRSFIFDWEFYTNSSIKFDKKIIKELLEKKDTRKEDNCSLTFNWDSYPEDNITTSLNCIKLIISKCKKTLYISTPYLYPPNDLKEILINASLMGVKIKFLLPSLPDNKWFIIYLNRIIYKEFLELDIEIYEYYGFNHAKFFIIDDDLILIGSTNLDPRALMINYETSILIKDKKLNYSMKKEFNSLINKSKKIDIKNLQKYYFSNIIKKLLLLFEPIL